MEATGLSIGKSVLHGAVSYATSALAEEVALQLGVRRDHLFIANELEMMQAFLMAAHDEGVDNMVVKVWVKQVRDVAYDVEDTLQEFALRLRKQSWWRIRRMLVDRRRVAKKMKELRANVEDVSQRNLRYNLIKGSGSKATTAAEQSSITSAALFGIDEARRVAKQEKSNVDLVQLINEKENELRVITVWGTSVDLGQTSIIRAVYENPDIQSKFLCRAWVRMMHPCNPKVFVQSLVEQFHVSVGINVLFEKKRTVKELTEDFNGFVNKKRYLIVINDLSTIEEWDQVKMCFPNNNMGSRIIVATPQVEVARLCAGQESIVSHLKQLSTNENIYAFHEKVSQHATYLTKTQSSSSKATARNDKKSKVSINEILVDKFDGAHGKKVIGKSLTRIRTMATALEESHVVGREKEKYEIIHLVASQATGQFQVISVWGMGGLGKTTLVKDIYHNKLSGMFDKFACVPVMRPFCLVEFLRSLVMQLDRESSDNKVVTGLMGSTQKTFLLMPLEVLIKELARLCERKRCLIVLDDVASTTEWDMIVPIFHEMESTIRIIVTTREKDIAKHCSEQKKNIYKLKGLEYKDARDLFARKVFKENVDLDKHYPQLVEQAELILRKCNRLPLAIVTIGGFLANQPKTVLEWRKLNEHISAELEMNPIIGTITTVLRRSYDGLPYHLKSCFLYLPIFNEDQRIGRGRLVRRWTAEGYSREVRGKSMEEIADGYFMELISRSMILPSQGSNHSTKGIDSCQVHDLMREIGISKSIEENLVFSLEEGCSSNYQATMRHLAINGNWKGDQSEFESIVDMSRVRSVTVFGECKSFFISNKMTLLRVLDLEDTAGLCDHHIKHIGKFLHLRYLSLRGCTNICHLPDSLGNLRELLTLDVRGTQIVKLPKSIINLEKLNNLRAGEKILNEDLSYEIFDHEDVMNHRACSLPITLVMSCLLWCAPRMLGDNDLTRRDVCNSFCCLFFPIIALHLDQHGVLVPRGVRKVKALHTLGVVNIGRHGKDVLHEIKGLIRLQKLGVTGVNKENGKELCSTIVGLSRLESLLIRSEGVPGLSGCLDGMFSFPENLESLKLYGNLVKLPEWIKGLNNLVKLKLRSSRISAHDDAIQVLGGLPNLAVLHLLKRSFQQDENQAARGEDENLAAGRLSSHHLLEESIQENENQAAIGENENQTVGRLTFPPVIFPSLVMLELNFETWLKSVEFEQGATPKLELLKLSNAEITSASLLGLPFLSSLKEVALYETNIIYTDNLQAELASTPNRPVIKKV